MSRKRENERDRSGTAVVAVMVVIFSVSALVGVMAASSVQRTFTAQRLTEQVKAQAIAEAGAHQAYSVLSTNFAARTNATLFPQTSYQGGTYDVAVKAVSNTMAVITCTGVYARAEVVTVLDVVKIIGGWGSGATTNASAFEFTIVSGSTIGWTGSGVMSGGAKIHSNQALALSGSGDITVANAYSSVRISTSGNSCRLTGNATAPAISDSKSRITGTKTVAPVPTVAIPQIDLTPYYNYALAHGQVYSGNNFQPPANPSGGIVWVNGSVKITGGELTGCYIATGDIDISGNAVQHKVGTYPAFVSRDGNIKMTGGATMEGLVYSRIGTIDFAGGGTLSGSIMSGGAFSKSGGSMVFNYVDSTPTAPGTYSPDIVTVSAWQK